MATKKNQLPEIVSARLSALLTFERDVAMLPKSASARNSRDHARFLLEQDILKAINAEKKRADDLAEALDRIASGGV